MLRKSFIFLVSLATALPAALGQSVHTASKKFDLQAGGGFSIAKADYVPQQYRGFNLYFDLDFRQHWGIEGVFHKVNQPSPGVMYEKTYEVGPRYTRQYKDGLFRPYIKGMYGRGVYNFQDNVANLAYNMFTGGGGLDVRVTPRINVRAFDYEYQKWFGFPPNGLSPQVVSFGVAYHFGSEGRFPKR